MDERCEVSTKALEIMNLHGTLARNISAFRTQLLADKRSV